MLTWKLKATTFSRYYFQLSASVRPTSATGSGLLLTPTCTQVMPTPERVQKRIAFRRSIGRNTYAPGNLTEQLHAANLGLLPTPTTDSANDRNAKYAQGGMPLAYAVKLLPTPTASDSRRGGAPVEANASGYYYRTSLTANGRPMGAQLSDIAHLLPTPCAADSQRAGNFGRGNPTLAGAAKLLPTPTVNDSKNASIPESQRNRDGLAGSILRGELLPTPLANCHTGVGEKGTGGPNLQTAIGGSLNPRFVAQMMGYPRDWCELQAPAPSN